MHNTRWLVAIAEFLRVFHRCLLCRKFGMENHMTRINIQRVWFAVFDVPTYGFIARGYLSVDYHSDAFERDSVRRRDCQR